MNIYETIIGTGLSLVFLSALFIPMENVFPAVKGQKVFRKNWLVDFMFFIGQYLFFSGLVFSVMEYFADSFDQIIPSSFRDSVHELNFYFQIFLIIFFSDLLIYWAHRIQHKVDFLWRFHKVHHSAEHLDWLAAHREHPIDTIYTVGIINLPAFILGFDVTAIASVIAFRGIWSIFIHSNIKLNIGFIKKIIGSPDLHHWHHSKERDVGNYANISPLMDLMFGTYHCPEESPENYGLNESYEHNYFSQIIKPFMIWRKY